MDNGLTTFLEMLLEMLLDIRLKNRGAFRARNIASMMIAIGTRTRALIAESLFRGITKIEVCLDTRIVAVIDCDISMFRVKV